MLFQFAKMLQRVLIPDFVAATTSLESVGSSILAGRLAEIPHCRIPSCSQVHAQHLLFLQPVRVLAYATY